MQELKNFCENDKINQLCELEKEEAEEEKHTVYANSSLNDDIRYEPLNCNSDLRSSLASGGVDRIQVKLDQQKADGHHNIYDSSVISDQSIHQPKEIRGQKILLLATKKREFKGLKLKGNQGYNSYEYGKSYKSTLDSFLKERLQRLK